MGLYNHQGYFFTIFITNVRSVFFQQTSSKYPSTHSHFFSQRLLKNSFWFDFDILILRAALKETLKEGKEN